MKKLKDAPKTARPAGTTQAQFEAHHRKRSCLRKKMMSRMQAESLAEASLSKAYRGPALRCYECRYCGYWHMTRQAQRGSRAQ